MSHSDACTLMSVASGDNMNIQAKNSGHKLKVTPSLVPCCEGKELQIQEDLVRCGLSAISVKHDGLGNCLSMSHACQRMHVPPGIMKRRNSFRCLHRPDLKRVSYLRRMAPEDLENLFQGYANITKLPHTKIDRFEVTKLIPWEFKDKRSPTRGQPLMDQSLEDTSGAEEIPEGKRLRGVKGKMITSVLASVLQQDQMDIGNGYYIRLDPDNEDTEQLQVILPPKPHDIFPATSFIDTNCSSLIKTN